MRVGGTVGSVADLAEIASVERGLGVVWTQDGSEDLNANLVRFEEGADLLEAQRASKAYLEKQAEQMVAEGQGVKEVHAPIGTPDYEIIGLAEELGADLVVVGSRGLGGMHRALLGSVSDSVVRHAYCSVLVVRDRVPA